MWRKATQNLAVMALAAALLAGLAYILRSHAQQPESYPAFSSFRTLPEGASALYEALRRIPGMSAERNTQALGTVHFADAAILLPGIQPLSLSGDGQWFGEMEELAAQGNRVIVALSPHRTRFLNPRQDQLEDSLKPWHVRLAFVRPTDIRDEEEDTLMSGWPLYFATSSGWETTRQENGRAVVIERAQGKGAIVLMANSYLLSNAAMVDDRQTAFLTRLIGPVHQVIFDETHFGIEETGSIAALARRYRLQGLILGLVLTAALFIWKSAAGFPPSASGQPTQHLTGEDASAAFLNLLRRNIRRDDILSTCVEEWCKMNRRQSGDRLQAAIDLAQSGRKTPVRTYAQIQNLLVSGPRNNWTVPKPFGGRVPDPRPAPSSGPCP